MNYLYEDFVLISWNVAGKRTLKWVGMSII